MDARFLGGALAQLGGQLLAGRAVGRQLGLEDLERGCAIASLASCSAAASRSATGCERLVAREPAALVLEPPRALGALALGALGEPLLGLDRGLDLRAALRARPLVGRGAALLDHPARVPLGLGGLVAGARGGARLAVDRVARGVGLGDLGLRGLDLRLRGPLGLGRDLDLLDQRVAAVALGRARGRRRRARPGAARGWRATRRARPW